MNAQQNDVSQEIFNEPTSLDGTSFRRHIHTNIIAVLIWIWKYFYQLYVGLYVETPFCCTVNIVPFGFIKKHFANLDHQGYKITSNHIKTLENTRIY